MLLIFVICNCHQIHIYNFIKSKIRKNRRVGFNRYSWRSQSEKTSETDPSGRRWGPGAPLREPPAAGSPSVPPQSPLPRVRFCRRRRRRTLGCRSGQTATPFWTTRTSAPRCRTRKVAKDPSAWSPFPQNTPQKFCRRRSCTRSLCKRRWVRSEQCTVCSKLSATATTRRRLSSLADCLNSKWSKQGRWRRSRLYTRCWCQKS